MQEAIIRHYQAADQRAVFELSADTAYFGDPVEAFLEDRRLYTDAFVSYYITYETPFAWIAESQDGITGFLLGCANTTRQARHWQKYIGRVVLMRALAGGYRLGRRTAGFAMGMLVGKIRGEEAKADAREYPAHLQIDVRQGYRGQGTGHRLIDAYLGQLRQLGIPGVHLETTSHNEAACRLYEKIGFCLLESHPNHFWTRKLGLRVENRSYGLIL